MRNLRIRTEISQNLQALLLFDDKSGVLVAFYCLTKSREFKEPKGIWLIDMNSKFSSGEKSETISSLITSVCRN